ncbi:hypothetical protein TNCV_3630531 [Trichonephila clavipes]|nr:hypothetical protein TNCV_3630531 [Trichonephila clavipes]
MAEFSGSFLPADKGRVNIGERVSPTEGIPQVTQKCYRSRFNAKCFHVTHPPTSGLVTSAKFKLQCRLPIDLVLLQGSFAMREKGGNCLVAGLDYMVDALKLPNQAHRGSGESLQKFVAWSCSDGTQQIFCLPILAISAKSLASNGPVVDSRDLNLVLGNAKATPNK